MRKNVATDVFFTFSWTLPLAEVCLLPPAKFEWQTKQTSRNETYLRKYFFPWHVDIYFTYNLNSRESTTNLLIKCSFDNSTAVSNLHDTTATNKQLTYTINDSSRTTRCRRQSHYYHHAQPYCLRQIGYDRQHALQPAQKWLPSRHSREDRLPNQLLDAGEHFNDDPSRTLRRSVAHPVQPTTLEGRRDSNRLNSGLLPRENLRLKVELMGLHSRLTFKNV